MNYFFSTACIKQQQQPTSTIRRVAQSKYSQVLASFNSNGLKQKFMSTLAASSRNNMAAASSATKPIVTHTKPIVAYWLYFNAGLVFTIVVVGGLTRLTESGLSIVEWNVISGMKPPRSEQEWREEFEKYKQYPEYKLLNRHMNLEEFKGIFYWEWGHRMLGRFIGMTLLLPAIYFARRGYMTKSVQKQVLFIFSVMGFQGFMGWYMVKSGLNEALMKEPGAVPRVSQYRLTAHLCTALVIYASAIFSAAGILRADKIANGTYPRKVAEMLNSPVLKPFKRYTHLLGGLMFITALSGGLVAGLDAGLIYTEYPKMGEGYIPPKDELWTDHYKKETDHGKWRNLLENPVTAQFDHRTLAELTALASTGLWFYSRRLPLPKNARNAVNTMMLATACQITLGICTLIYMVPISLAATHQAGALALLTSNFWLIHALRKVRL
ncbi:MAG: COX15/CtaA family [Benjaminiella poitrasii]|nr:MAG: COX15/CtaA family [Benjaminiella poitrasii]